LVVRKVKPWASNSNGSVRRRKHQTYFANSLLKLPAIHLPDDTR
jgi:hypothetical protein